MKFISSGNYLLNVFDYSSNTKLFSIPFFVTEQAGKINSRVETLYNSGNNFSASDQLFSIYEYPEEVEFPQFDLSFRFVTGFGEVQNLRKPLTSHLRVKFDFIHQEAIYLHRVLILSL